MEYKLCRGNACNNRIHRGEKCIYGYIGWYDGGFSYFCSIKCADEYCKDMPITDNREYTFRKVDL